MPLFLIARRLINRLNRYRVIALITLAVAIILIGALAFSLTQHLSYGISLYWAVTTATTVGYGDVLPHNTVGRILAMVVMLTTIPIVGAVFALVAGATVISHMRRLLGMDNTLPTGTYSLVYGDHPVLARVLTELAENDEQALVVCAERPAALEETHHFISGDPTLEAVVKRSAPEQASRALIACSTDADTLVTAVHVHALAPDLEIYALSQTANVASALTDLGVTHTLASDEIVGHTLAKSLETPQAGDVLLSLLGGVDYRMTQEEVPSELVGKTLSQARDRASALVLGLSHAGKVDLGVVTDPVLDSGDTLILLRLKER